MNQTEQIGVRMTAWDRDLLEHIAETLPRMTTSELVRVAIFSYIGKLIEELGDPTENRRAWLERVREDGRVFATIEGSAWTFDTDEPNPPETDRIPWFSSEFMKDWRERYDLVRDENGKPVDVKRR